MICFELLTLGFRVDRKRFDRFRNQYTCDPCQRSILALYRGAGDLSTHLSDDLASFFRCGRLRVSGQHMPQLMCKHRCEFGLAPSRSQHTGPDEHMVSTSRGGVDDVVSLQNIHVPRFLIGVRSAGQLHHNVAS
jgi:hypothetical protein